MFSFVTEPVRVGCTGSLRTRFLSVKLAYGTAPHSLSYGSLRLATAVYRLADCQLSGWPFVGRALQGRLRRRVSTPGRLTDQRPDANVRAMSAWVARRPRPPTQMNQLPSVGTKPDRALHLLITQYPKQAGCSTRAPLIESILATCTPGCHPVGQSSDGGNCDCANDDVRPYR